MAISACANLVSLRITSMFSVLVSCTHVAKKVQSYHPPPIGTIDTGISTLFHARARRYEIDVHKHHDPFNGTTCYSERRYSGILTVLVESFILSVVP